MKVLVIGAGSIGTRHLSNLLGLGHEVYVADVNPGNIESLPSEVSGAFSTVDEALRIRPDIVFICTFSNSHVQVAQECAKAGCNLFIEKPLSVSSKGVPELIEVIKEKEIISMVGCNMRFHPALSKVHEILTNDPAFSRELWAGLEFGYYLPFAKEDYASSYMANRNLGGNLIFDVIHELDYAVWFFGEAQEVFCTKGILSNLRIDTEDFVEMIIKFKSGCLCRIHLDYLQHGYSRRCKIVSEKGTLVWDASNGTLGTISVETPQWNWENIQTEIYYNQMFIDEIEYFLDCVLAGENTFNSVEKSLPVLRLAISAERSCKTQKFEKV